MTLSRIQMIKTFSAVCLLLPVLAGCTALVSVRPESVKAVRAGSVADIRFLCSLQNGDIVAATDKAVAQQTALSKSAVFLARDKDGPVSVIATATLPMPDPPKIEWAFEEEIINRLAGSVIGMKEGEKRTVELTAGNLPERRQDDYVIKIARVRERVKEIRMKIAEYMSRTGKSPEEGQSFVSDTAVPGRVQSVTQDEVVIRFSAKPGEVVQTPFGPGRITETEETYDIRIDASKGALVRSGPLVGRISGVDDKYITIDYLDPFGGEKLFCEVTVEKVSDAGPASVGSGK